MKEGRVSEEKMMEENVTSQELIEKREREKAMVSDMIRVYCKGNHAAYDKKNKCLCKECQALDDYARMRSDKCPFMETKTFCSNCKVHCYKPEMRQRIKEVMRYSGPRMLFVHPVACIRHLVETRREKKRLETT